MFLLQNEIYDTLPYKETVYWKRRKGMDVPRTRMGWDGYYVPNLVIVSTSIIPMIEGSRVAAIVARATVSTFNGCTPIAPRNDNLPPNREFIPDIPATTLLRGVKCGRSVFEYINPCN